MTLKDFFIALFVPFAWGLGFVAAKSGLDHFPPLLIMGLRFAVSSFITFWLVPIPNGYLKEIFFIAFISATLQYGLTFSGLKILDTSSASLLVQTEVVFGIIIAAIFLKEIPTLKQIFGIIIAFSGTILLMGSPSLEGKLVGAFYVLSGTFFWAIGQVMIKNLKGAVGGFTLICWIGIFSSPQMIFLSLIFDGNPLPLIYSAKISTWLTVLYLGVVMTVLGYGAWYYILSKYPVAIAMPFLLFIPVTAIIGAIIFFGDRPDIKVLFGGAVIIIGVSIIILDFQKIKSFLRLKKHDLNQ